MFASPMFAILVTLNRYITGGPISFNVEDVPTQYFDSVRLLASSSKVGCFDVSEPHVSIVF